MKVITVGILVTDLIAAALPKVADPGEVVFTPRGIKTRIGGHPANLSIDLVKLGLKGEEIALIGSVGEDLYGRFIEETLKSYGIKTFLYRSKTSETSKNLILVVEGEDRRFHVDVGANKDLDPNFVRKILENLEAPILYIGATGWLGKFDDELPLFLKDSKRKGQLTFVDVIAPYGKDYDYIIPALQYTDIFHCNNIEASSLTGVDKLEEAVEKLLEMGVKMAIVTMGEKGLYATTPEWSIRLGAFKVNVVDPTGAGDAFCAGVIYKLLKENIFEVEELDSKTALDILVFASAVGASATTMEGTTAGVSRKFVDKIVEEQGEKLVKTAKIRKLI
ncbi:MAG TPA: carbohydrate kinase family protein [Thermoproteales archaeon]|nr:carbohydrate kinase family protein [Thermoproteales archaeon]